MSEFLEPTEDQRIEKYNELLEKFLNSDEYEDYMIKLFQDLDIDALKEFFLEKNGIAIGSYILREMQHLIIPEIIKRTELWSESGMTQYDLAKDKKAEMELKDVITSLFVPI